MLSSTCFKWRLLGEECTLQQLHGCLESLQSVTKGKDLALVTTRQELCAFASGYQSPQLILTPRFLPGVRHLSSDDVNPVWFSFASTQAKQIRWDLLHAV
ncbi:hypothetical protein TNCV_3466181 [Trichonephila clavipes]|nr:hypothetical protein TNCV_3466181 [Trichonephila clavipes]